MKFAKGSADGEAVYAYPVNRPNTNRRSLKDSAARRRARDMTWVILAREGWSLEEIASEFVFTIRHVRRRVNSVLNLGRQDLINWPSRENRRTEEIVESRDRVIVYLSGIGMTHADIADIWNLTRRRVAQILIESKSK